MQFILGFLACILCLILIGSFIISSDSSYNESYRIYLRNTDYWIRYTDRSDYKMVKEIKLFCDSLIKKGIFIENEQVISDIIHKCGFELMKGEY